MCLIGGSAVCSSKRIDGAVKLHYEKRAKVGQRPPLTVEQVKALETTVTNPSRSTFDRVMAGYFLMLVYGRPFHLREKSGICPSQFLFSA